MSDTPLTHLSMAGGHSLALGVVGNGTIAALVDARGGIVWCCWPRFDADPVFSELLAGELHPAVGVFRIEIEDFARSEQRYERGTAVLRTRLWNHAGQGIEIVDFAPRFEHHGRLFRPAQLVRRIAPIGGKPRVRIRLVPRADRGSGRPVLTRGSNHLRYVLADQVLRLTTNAPLAYVTDARWFSLNGPTSLLLGPDETFEGAIETTARDFEEHTIGHWCRWTHRLAVPFDWQEAVIRAAITLKMCQYEETGAIVAALTTSIPEAPNSGRNWDYRYCWLRDAFFVVRALNSLSEVGTMETYLRWLYDMLRDGRDAPLQPLYGIALERELDEAVLPGWPGYRGMGPVRVGNLAYTHSQHDVYGNVVLGATQAFFDHRLYRRADRHDFELLEGAGERAWLLHDQPDAGMWELRTRAAVHTSSSLMCWAACDRLAKIAAALGLADRRAFWLARADTIRARILAEAWNPQRQAFTDRFGGQHLDAGVLLMAEVGFIDPRDPRFVSTVEALERTLGDGPFMRRYEAADDFGVPETSFTVCSFWRLDALARIGRTAEARELFEALLAARNPLGLLSEDIDARTGELWGNFPQTYSLVGVINGAMRLSRAWDQTV